MNPLFATNIYWHLPIMIVLISLVYSATRYEHWDAILHDAWRWARNMIVFLAGVAVVLYVLARFVFV
jgi:hypothetical protein